MINSAFTKTIPGAFVVAFITLSPLPVQAVADYNQVSQIMAIEASPPVVKDDPNVIPAKNMLAETELAAFIDPTRGCPISSMPLQDQKWKTLRAHIYADIDAQKNILLGGYEMQNYLNRVMVIANAMNQSDVDALYKFYQSPKGQRYQEYRTKIDSLLAKIGPPPEEKHDTSHMMSDMANALRYNELLKHAAEMTLYSKLFMDYIDSQPTDLSPGIMGMVSQGIALQKPDEFEALYNEYKADFDDFKVFRLSQPSQNFINAYRQSKSTPVPYGKGVDRKSVVLTQLRDSWTSFCVAQMAGK